MHILGSAAGGGVPQWNCSCKNCQVERQNINSYNRRTQSSVAVNIDKRRWIILNASPDIRTQIISFSELGPAKGAIRDSAIEAIVLTDGEMDHILGLLSLREHSKLHLVCTGNIRRLLTYDFPLLKTLEKYCSIRYSTFPFYTNSLVITALDVSAKKPLYAQIGSKISDIAVGIKLRSTKTKKIMVYLPCLPAITDNIKQFVDGCDCLLVDGTFWSNQEMISLGITKRNAYEMGHVPIEGKNGSLTWLSSLDIPKKIYIHINNTNPILLKTSKERKIVDKARIEVGYDGMEFMI